MNNIIIFTAMCKKKTYNSQDFSLYCKTNLYSVKSEKFIFLAMEKFIS